MGRAFDMGRVCLGEVERTRTVRRQTSSALRIRRCCASIRRSHERRSIQIV